MAININKKIHNSEFEQLVKRQMKSSTVFIIVAGYIRFLRDTVEPINKYVPNSHIEERFLEVIDALAMEIYLAVDFKQAGLEIGKYAVRDFSPLDGLSPAEAAVHVHAAYQSLRRKDGEIRNTIKLADIRIETKVMAIKCGRTMAQTARYIN